MWLIRTADLKLEYFPSDFTLSTQHISYAILSHTWLYDSYGNVAEVTFSDLHLPSASISSTTAASSGASTPSASWDPWEALKRKRGWHKFQSFCARAAAIGFGYAWMDTCCIDRSSSSELSEAISGMFRWYQQAAVCFAYLEDVETDPAYPQMAHPAHFERSRWFTRGWTLQELLSPKNLEFYTKTWARIGDKFSLRHAIKRATGIEPRFLYDFRYASIAQKFSWAANRTTALPEDRVYSLLGLFEINLPLIYGEGYEGAFKRFQREVIKESNDQSIFCWNPPEEQRHHHMRFGCDIFATRLEDFSIGGNIVRLPNFPLGPYAMTNKGLEITNPLSPAPRHDFGYVVGESISPQAHCELLTLNCCQKTSETQCKPIRLLLRKFVNSDNEYSRLCLWEGRPSSPPAKGNKTTIYIRNSSFLDWYDSAPDPQLAVWDDGSSPQFLTRSPSVVREKYERDCIRGALRVSFRPKVSIMDAG